MMLTRKVALGVAGAVAAAVLGTAGVAAATADDSAPAAGLTAQVGALAPATPGATASPGAKPGDKAGDKKGHKHRAGKEAKVRGMHGEWVVKGKDGKPVTLVSIRGSVTAAGPTTVTVRAEDGYTATFTASAATKVRGGADSPAGVKVGAKGAVVGTRTGTTLTARTISIRK